jgi:hypothetical protein
MRRSTLAWAVIHAIGETISAYAEESRERVTKLIDKTIRAVKECLGAEIWHWDFRSAIFEQKETVGEVDARLNSKDAVRRAEELEFRMRRQFAELVIEKPISVTPPVLVASANVMLLELPKKLTGGSNYTFAGTIICLWLELMTMKTAIDTESSLASEINGRTKGTVTATASNNKSRTVLNKLVEEVAINAIYMKKTICEYSDVVITTMLDSLKVTHKRGKA